MGIVQQVNLGFNKRRDTLPRKRTKPLDGNAFSQRIALLRKREGLTMTALADQIGVTASYISLLEAGDRQPSREIVLKMARLFFGPEDLEKTDELLVLAGLSPVSYELRNHPQDTRTIYEEQLKKQPEDFKTFTALIRLLLRQGEYTAAENLIYEGLKRFQQASRLQALLSQQQLCLKSYETAVTFQRSAIALYSQEQASQKLNTDPDFADLHTNLGVIYFLWGTSFFEQSLVAPAEAASDLKAIAFQHFQQALKAYQQAMAITPEDIFLLDEYARICFNLADLSQGQERLEWWQQTIAAFKAVICAEDVGALGLDSVRETNAFLAHAYSKLGQFEQARMLIGVIQSCTPDYWLIYYIKACYYSLRIAAGHPEDIKAGLAALKQALHIPHPLNATRDYAPHDADLSALAQADPKGFERLIKKSRPES